MTELLYLNVKKRVKNGLKLLRGEVIGAYPARRDPRGRIQPAGKDFIVVIFATMCTFFDSIVAQCLWHCIQYTNIWFTLYNIVYCHCIILCIVIVHHCVLSLYIIVYCIILCIVIVYHCVLLLYIIVYCHCIVLCIVIVWYCVLSLWCYNMNTIL